MIDVESITALTTMSLSTLLTTEAIDVMEADPPTTPAPAITLSPNTMLAPEAMMSAEPPAV